MSSKQAIIGSNNWFNEKFLNDNNFKVLSDDGQYGKAESIKPLGYRTLSFNREGVSCDYFGNPLENNVAMEVRLDAGGRSGFNGIVYNAEDFIKVMTLVR